MGDWTFTTGNALTRKAWAKKWWIEAKTESYFYGNGFVGTGTDNIIVEFPDLEKDQGDVITYGQLRELSGAGIANDSTMEGQEEAPLTYDDTITLAQIRNAICSAGKESEMRPSDSGLRTWAKELLQRWMSAQIDQAIFTALGDSCTKIIYGGDATTTVDIDSSDIMKPTLIAKLSVYAKKANPLIVGPTVKGKSTAGVLVMCPDQRYDLEEEDDWENAQKYAMQRGADNPLFTGAIGFWKGVICHEHPRVALATTWGNAGTGAGAKALFMGVQAGAIGYSKRKIWEEKTFDYGNKTGFCIGAIYGVSKSVFNAADNAVVALYTWRTNN